MPSTIVTDLRHSTPSGASLATALQAPPESGGPSGAGLVPLGRSRAVGVPLPAALSLGESETLLTVVVGARVRRRNSLRCPNPSGCRRTRHAQPHTLVCRRQDSDRLIEWLAVLALLLSAAAARWAPVDCPR